MKGIGGAEVDVSAPDATGARGGRRRPRRGARGRNARRSRRRDIVAQGDAIARARGMSDDGAREGAEEAERTMPAGTTLRVRGTIENGAAARARTARARETGLHDEFRIYSWVRGRPPHRPPRASGDATGPTCAMRGAREALRAVGAFAPLARVSLAVPAPPAAGWLRWSSSSSAWGAARSVHRGASAPAWPSALNPDRDHDARDDRRPRDDAPTARLRGRAASDDASASASPSASRRLDAVRASPVSRSLVVPPRAALRLARALHGTPTLSFAAKLPTSGHASKDPSARASLGSLRSPADGRLDAAADARSLRAVDVAIKANTAICACKLAAYAVTGSSAMLAEAVHSVADILNQSLLQLGIRSSSKAPDASYNYGYRRARFVWSLISAVGVFFMGSGVTFVHGMHGLYHPVELEHIWVGLSVLGASAAIDAYSLHVAFGALRENADAKNMTLSEFVESGHDPTSVAVVAEDAAAVSGCVVAAAALAAAQYTATDADAGAVPAAGALLGATATYLINSNRKLLLGRSLGEDKMNAITDAMRRDPVVSEVYRAKSEELGPRTFRFVAEIEFSGRGWWSGISIRGTGRSANSCTGCSWKRRERDRRVGGIRARWTRR